jgi:hypothetical protein
MLKYAPIVYRILIGAAIGTAAHFAVLVIGFWSVHIPIVWRLVMAFYCMFIPPFLFAGLPAVLVLAATGGLMAWREERLIQQGRLVRKKGRQEQLKQLIYRKDLPRCAADHIARVVKKMRYSFRVRCDVAQELADHFEDALKDCPSEEEKQQKAQELIADCGDAKLLAVLARRAKKRCRLAWQKAMLRSLQATGILIVLCSLYTAWFVSGKPAVSVDYLQIINEMARPKAADEDNAWPNYEKAFALLAEPNEAIRQLIFRTSRSISDSNEPDVTTEPAVKEWLQKKEPAWQEFVKASLKPYWYKPWQYYSQDSEKWLLNVVLDYLGPFRYLAVSGIWRSRIATQQGDVNQALEDCCAVIRASQHLHNNRVTIMDQLAGATMAALGYKEILNITATQELTIADLKRLLGQLEQAVPGRYVLRDKEASKICFLDTVQHIFTDGGPGGGHLVPEKFIYLLEFTGDVGKRRSAVAKRENLFALYTAKGIVHAGRNDTIEMGNCVIEQFCELAELTPYERHIRGISEEQIVSAIPENRFSFVKYYFSRFRAPNLGKAYESFYRNSVLCEATLAVLALQHWRLEKGEFPQNLQELLDAGYLKELPMDPYSDKPLVYKRLDNSFTLYSLGADFDDDGGTPSNWGEGDKGGDAVFWPVTK